jgi:exodeoxyribonuclease-3
MKIISWNVAGLRAILKKENFKNMINEYNPDILCLQETKAEETQVKIDEDLDSKYKYRFWNSTKGTSQRKGLSGVCIWCSSPPINNLKYPEFDEEGRILTLEFDNFILINVYVPNSQKLECERYYFREKWNIDFMNYIYELKKEYNKELIICGDFNVAHLDIDICNPKKKKNKVAGFFDNERLAFTKLLEKNELIDFYRKTNPSLQKSTYWSNFLKAERSKYNGWGIDYYLITSKLINSIIKCNILINILGSDHCPIELILN